MIYHDISSILSYDVDMVIDMIEQPRHGGGPKYDELGRRIDRQKKVSDSSSDEVQWRNAGGCRQKKGIEIGPFIDDLPWFTMVYLLKMEIFHGYVK